MEISQSEFDDWMINPVTKQFFASLALAREDIKEGWANQKFIRDTPEMTAMENARALGMIEAIEDIINTQLEDINGPVA